MLLTQLEQAGVKLALEKDGFQVTHWERMEEVMDSEIARIP